MPGFFFSTDDSSVRKAVTGAAPVLAIDTVHHTLGNEFAAYRTEVFVIATDYLVYVRLAVNPVRFELRENILEKIFALTSLSRQLLDPVFFDEVRDDLISPAGGLPVGIFLEPLVDRLFRNTPLLTDFVSRDLSGLYFARNDLNVHLEFFGEFRGGKKLGVPYAPG
jgi:hypothetical protein